jgi:DNA-binding transcriptional ArsR family regulator
MAKPLYHPTFEQIQLAGVLDALSDPVRLDIVLRLDAEGEAQCSALGDYGSKTNLSYHFARLREAGVTQTRAEGPFRIISIRRDDLEAKFPGLIDSILNSARGAADAARPKGRRKPAA